MSSQNGKDPIGSQTPERLQVTDLDALSDSTLSNVSTPTSSPETLRRPAMSAAETDQEDTDAREPSGEMDIDVAEPLNPESPSSRAQSRKSSPTAEVDENKLRSPSPKSSEQIAPEPSVESRTSVTPEKEEVEKQEEDKMNLDESGVVVSSRTSVSPSPETAPVATISSKDPIGTKLTGDAAASHKAEVAELAAVLAKISPAAALAGVTQYCSKNLLGTGNIEEIYLAVKTLTSASEKALTAVLKHAEQRLLEVANENCKQFLDRAVEVRMESIEAAKLVKFLAQAKRLGYGDDDIVEDESVCPPYKASDIIRAVQAQTPQQGPMGQMPPPPQFAPYQNYQFTNYGSPYVQQVPGAALGLKSCDYCGQTFKQNAGLRYHLEKGVCRKDAGPQGPVMATCPTCGKEFRSPGGYHYHVTNKVCDHLVQDKSSPAPEAAEGEKVEIQSEEDTKEESQKIPTPNPPKASLPTLQPARPPLQPSHSAPSGQPLAQQGNFIVKSQPAPLSMAPPAAHTDPTFQHQPIRMFQPGPGPMMAVMSAMDGGLGTSQHPTPELTPEVAQKLNDALKAEDAKFEKQMSELPGTLRGDALKAEIKRLKAGMSTRKSNLRRKHNIFVRKTDKAPANAVRNDDGTISVVPAGVHVSVGSGFAPINRPDPPVGSRGTPTMSSSTPTPGIQGPAHPPPSGGEPDAKRQRLSNGPPATPNYGPPNGYYQPHQYFNNQPVPYMSSPYSQDPNAAYHHQAAMQSMYGQPYQMNTIIRAPGAPGGPPAPPAGPPSGHFAPINGFVAVNTQHVSPYGPPPQQPSAPPPPAAATPTPAQTPIPSVEQPTQQQPFYVDQTDTNGHGHPKPTFGVLKEKSKPKIVVDKAEKLWKDQKQIWKVNSVAPKESNDSQKEKGAGQFSKFSVRKDRFSDDKNGAKDGAKDGAEDGEVVSVHSPTTAESGKDTKSGDEDEDVEMTEAASEPVPDNKSRKSLPAVSTNGDASVAAVRKSGRNSLPTKPFSATNGEAASAAPRASPRRTRKSAVLVKSDSEDTEPESK